MEDGLGGWEVTACYLLSASLKVEILLVASKDLHIFEDLDQLDSLQQSWHVWDGAGIEHQRHPRSSNHWMSEIHGKM